jgi:hypothetical protein
MKDDFDDLFALTKNLDLAITACTNIIDFCGAVGARSIAWTPLCGLIKLTMEEPKTLWFNSVHTMPRFSVTPWMTTIEQTAILAVNKIQSLCRSFV